MTQFETNLNSMRVNLDAEQQVYEQEKWAQLRATELEDYRRQQEAICNEGIAVLQQRRDESIRQKEEQLQARLRNDIDQKFGAARKKLEEVQALFSTEGIGNN